MHADQTWRTSQGCDASILIAPAGKETGDKVERDMLENRNLPQYGFDTVEMAKAAVETKCPGVVSCADILALAARDAVQLVRTPAIIIVFLGKGVSVHAKIHGATVQGQDSTLGQ
jgi:hypothetical protein